MHQLARSRAVLGRGVWLAMVAVVMTGCRSTVKVTNTTESASQQLLLNSTADAVIGSFDFSPLAGRLCYLDMSGLGESGKGYVKYRIREEMGCSGVRLAESRDDAEVVIEAGVAVYGTDSYNNTVGLTGADRLPDVNLCVSDAQFGVSKISLFAIERESGTTIWHSGTMRADSRQDIRNTLGVGPRFSGTIVHPAHRVERTDSGAYLIGGSCLGLN